MNYPDFEFAHRQFPLAPHTYYRVGGPAHVALQPRTVDETKKAYAWMQEQSQPALIIGGGSNVLISDAGFPGIVLFTTQLRKIKDMDDGRYFIASGVKLDAMVREVMLPANARGVGGLTGIPGTVGGAIFMNAGTLNGSACQLLESVDLLKPTGFARVPVTKDHYGYRRQTFCSPGDVILGGVFRFTRSEENQQAVYDHYQSRRLKKQPQGHCCGSVFKNPPGKHAGELIEACGLKGTRQGGALISPQHANFIMNENHATFDDILALIHLAEKTVKEKFGVELAREVRIIASESDLVNKDIDRSV